MLTILDGLNDLAYAWNKPPGFPSIPENQIPTCEYLREDGTFQSCSRNGKLHLIYR
jgi:hypothetical protein